MTPAGPHLTRSFPGTGPGQPGHPHGLQFPGRVTWRPVITDGACVGPASEAEAASSLESHGAGLQAPPRPRPLRPARRPPDAAFCPDTPPTVTRAWGTRSHDGGQQEGPSVKPPGTLHGAETEGSPEWSGQMQVSANGRGSRRDGGDRGEHFRFRRRRDHRATDSGSALRRPRGLAGNSDSLAPVGPETLHLQVLPGRLRPETGTHSE